MFTSAAMADDLTFTFTHDVGGNSVNVSASQLTFSQPNDVSVKNSMGTVINFGPGGCAGISSSNGTYTAIPGLSVTATYAGGAPGVTQVSVTGGPGDPCSVCLQGDMNTGTYTGLQGQVGSFSGIFHVTFLSQSLLAAFGDAGQFPLPNGSDSFTSTRNMIGATSTSALLGSGSISVQTTAIPEPASLALLGTAIVGVAGRIRRKR